MSDYVILQFNCFMFGFLGGLSGLTIALFGLKQLIVQYYIRYFRAKDYMLLHNRVHQLVIDVSDLCRKEKSIRKDIAELYLDQKSEAK